MSTSVIANNSTESTTIAPADEAAIGSTILATIAATKVPSYNAAFGRSDFSTKSTTIRISNYSTNIQSNITTNLSTKRKSIDNAN